MQCLPDIRAQIEAFPALQPARRLRDTAIAAVLLMDSQIDHVTGLLTLREGCPHPVWCTEMVHQDLTSGFPLFTMLQHWNGGLVWNPIALDGEPFTIPACPGLRFTAIALRSSAPPYSPHRGNPHPGDNIGLFVEDLRTGGSLFYAPGLGQVDEALLGWMRRADCLLVDGTLWRDDEMRVCEVGDKLGSEMGHLPQSGRRHAGGARRPAGQAPGAHPHQQHQPHPRCRFRRARRTGRARHRMARDGMAIRL